MHRRKERKFIFGSLFDVPVNSFGKTVTVEIRAFREIILQGCSGILEYSPSLIVMESAQGKISVTGSDLSLSVFSEELVMIRGMVEEISQMEVNCGGSTDESASW